MTFVKWENGAFVEVKANPEYFFSGSTVTEYTNGAYVDEKPGVYKDVAYGTPGGDVALTFKRGPFSQSTIYSVYQDQNSAVLALEKGEIDYMATPLGLQRGFKQRIDAVPNLKILTNAPNGIRYMGFNLRKPPMDNTPAGKAFRQAVATLIDKEFVTTSILQRVADPAYTMVPPGNGFYYNTNVPQWGKTAEGTPMSREQRINEAVRLLKEAGFTWEVEPKWNTGNLAVDAGRGLKMPNGEPVPQLELLAPSAGYDPLRSTFAIWIERWLNEAGIPLRANLTGFNVIVAKVFTEQDFDMWMLGWGLTVFPDYLENFFHSKYSEKEGNNAGGYSNPEYDKLAETLVAETDVNKAKEITFKMQEFLADELPYVVLFTTQILEPVSTNVKFPFETILDGIQNYFQSANGPLAYTQFQ
jgi:ABC-type transport system substrate-binding protein